MVFEKMFPGKSNWKNVIGKMLLNNVLEKCYWIIWKVHFIEMRN